MGHDSSKADRLYMRGPGGRGEVEVAVSGIAGHCLFLSHISLIVSVFSPKSIIYSQLPTHTYF